MRLRLDLAYDGAGFHGWARQPGLRTVQAHLEESLDTVLRTTGTALTVAGRTDTGVHARGQVAHVDVERADLEAVAGPRAGPRAEPRAGRRPESASEALVRRLNGLLDPDVRVRDVTVAPPGFDARFSAAWRRYAYRIADRPSAVDPLTRGHVVTRLRPLDLDAMNEAAVMLLGEHDFAAFCRRRAGATTIRSLLELHWSRNAEEVAVGVVRADAFCHHMVRALTGCLVAVGEGRRPPRWAGEVLSGGRRDPAVTVLRAHGLTLEEVAYPPDAELEEQAVRSRVVRTLPDTVR